MMGQGCERERSVHVRTDLLETPGFNKRNERTGEIFIMPQTRFKRTVFRVPRLAKEALLGKSRRSSLQVE